MLLPMGAVVAAAATAPAARSAIRSRRPSVAGAAAVARHVPRAPRAAAARRLPARRAGLDGAARVRGAAAAASASADCRFTDAYFEAVSGLTATGATVLDGLDELPPSINIWRGLHDLARRHGHHRAGGGDPADARRRRHASCSRPRRRPDEGRQAHAAHRRDREGAVARLRRLHRSPASSPTGSPAWTGSTR